MKIAWFTPFSNGSAIGKMSQLVIDTLQSDHHIDLWLHDANEKLLTSTVNTIFYAQNYKINWEVCQQLTNYDVIIYNMGDNFFYHATIYKVLQKYSGVIILHDYVNHHFFTGYYFQQNKQSQYIELMRSLYGQEGRTIALDSINNKILPVWETDAIVNYPLFEPIVVNALAVITHSHWVTKKIRPFFTGALTCLHLPYEPSSLFPQEKPIQAVSTKIKLLTIGNVNQNKCIHQVIKILGSNKELANKVHYDIIGSTENNFYFTRLVELLEFYGLADVVQFHGYQPNDILYEYLSNADICINLRFPAMEAASGSIIEELYFGKATIVTDTGCYAELPDNVVLKVNPFIEQQLLDGLNKLINNATLREHMGIDGKKYIQLHHTASNYAKNLIHFCQKIVYLIPVLQLTDKVAIEYKNMSAQAFMPAMDITSREISLMTHTVQQAAEEN